ncbi:F-box only protein [Ooceraea biroi]|uniref:F-box only protein n=1 Tax=Ooceraea biroi TaxID=2015173 RepID=A0A026VV75_OOCBI|nr:F-box only protein [Ooceraea biroi]
MQCKIDDLPDELLEYILSLIPPYKDFQECRVICKRWYRVTKNVIDHNRAHFQKSIASGSLLWNSLPSPHWAPTIGKRHSHSACIYDNSMYVFGGCTATWTTFNDLWQLDLDTRTWIRPMTMGSYPSPKACATMLHYKKNLILFGGWSHPSPYPLHQQWKLFNELHVYSIESNKWTAISTLEAPPPISAHSATIHKNLMIVFGGVNDGYRQGSLSTVDRDENVNGRHGAFSRSHSQNAHIPSHTPNISKIIPLYSDNTLSMAAFRDQPLRNNSSTNRRRQETLRRMEEKLRNKRAHLMKVFPKAENTLSIYVLDITNVFSDDCNASWIPVKQNDHSGPDEKILYSLVEGRGELIVFGGIRKEHSMLDQSDDSVVYNDLHFIRPPRYII